MLERRPAKYPWRTAKVGDAFIINDKVESYVRPHASRTGKLIGRTFSVKKLGDKRFKVKRVA